MGTWRKRLALFVLGSVACVLLTLWRIEADNKCRAHQGCKELARAIDSYIWNPSSTETPPFQSLDDLIHPPWGGTLLRNGADDLRDPWGERYELERRKHADGTEYFLVKTVARDGTLISQFGIGEHAVPR